MVVGTCDHLEGYFRHIPENIAVCDVVVNLELRRREVPLDFSIGLRYRNATGDVGCISNRGDGLQKGIGCRRR